MKQLRFFDAFCGIGGFHLGLAALGYKCVGACEIDKKAAEMYEANFGIKPQGDIREIKKLPAHDIFCAGFPCQDFSISGKKKGFNSVRGSLIFEVIRLVEQHRPKIVLLENVPNIIRIHKGKVFDTINKSFTSLGYNVFYDLLNAGDYGIPQQRKRVYWVILKKDSNLSYFPPAPTHEECSLRDILLPDSETKHLAIKQGHYNRINIYKKNSKVKMIAFRTVNPQRKTAHRDSRLIDTRGHCYTIDKDYTPIFNRNSNKCKKTAQRGQGENGQGNRIYDPDNHAITQKVSGGGMGGVSGLYIVGGVVRRLHIKEVKRVMGFPEDYKTSSGTRGQRQLGNAVIPRMITTIAENIRCN